MHNPQHAEPDGPTDFYRPEARPTLLSRLLPVVGVLFLILLIDAVFGFIQIRSALNSTALGLDVGRTALLEGRLVDAERAFSEVEDPLGAARGYKGHPGVAATRLLFPNDHEVLDAFLGVSEDAQQAGFEAISAVKALGGVEREDFAGTLFQDGRLQLGLIARARQHIDAAQAHLSSSKDLLEDVGNPFFPFLERALESARGSISSTTKAAQQGDLILDLIPRLGGGEGPRNYLVLFLSTAEGRGTGGSLALYSTLTADSGDLRLGRVHPFTELELGSLRRADAPDWYLRRYAQPLELGTFELPSDERLQNALKNDPTYGPLLDLYASLSSPQNRVNFSPDLPTVAEVILQLFERETGERLDGVMTFDPIALGDLTAATGPLVGKGLSTPITAQNAEQVTLLESYLEFGGDIPAQIRYTRSLIRNFWDELVSGQADAIQLVEALGTSIRTQHIRFYARDEVAQDTLSGLGASGGLAVHGPNAQMVYHNSLGSRVDYFLQRSLDIDVALQEDGSARVTTTARLTNGAPNGPPSALLGPFVPGDEPGVNHMQLNFVLPEGAQVLAVSDETGSVEFERGRELSYPVVWHDIAIEAGETREVSVTYDLPKESTGGFTLELLAAPTIAPDAFTLSFSSSAGTEVVEATESGSEITIEGNSATLTGHLDQHRTVLIKTR